MPISMAMFACICISILGCIFSPAPAATAAIDNHGSGYCVLGSLVLAVVNMPEPVLVA